MGLVEQYWDGVLRRLQAEVDGFNRLIAHHGERGRENELALVRVLQALVPSRYAVGTGLLIDSFDAVSRQCDVVLFEQAAQPRMLAQTTQLLHPLETVRAVIEVKTMLTPEAIRDAAVKKASVRALRPFGDHRYSDGSEHPLFMLFAYRADASPAAVARNLYELEAADRPDLVCVISHGLIAGGSSLVSADVAPTDAGYAVAMALLVDERGEPIESSDGALEAEHEGALYPVLRCDGRDVLVHPAKALLLFTDGLLRGLAALDGVDAPVTSAYLSAAAYGLVTIPAP